MLFNLFVRKVFSIYKETVTLFNTQLFKEEYVELNCWVFYIPSHDQTFVVSVLRFKLIVKPMEAEETTKVLHFSLFYSIFGQYSHLVPPENLWFSCFCKGYKIGKLATEGLILNRILNITRSNWFYFIHSENTRKAEVSWCFQAV